MKTILAEEVIRIARTVENHKLHTLDKRKPFTLQVKDDSILFFIGPQQRRSPVTREKIQQVCDVFVTQPAFKRRAYGPISSTVPYLRVLFALVTDQREKI